MKISIDKQRLGSALETVTKAASGKSTLSVLEGVLLETTYNSLYLSRNNTDVAIKYKADCDVIQPGEVIVNAKLFTDIIKKMPEDEIEITAADNNVTIKSGQTKTEIGVIQGKFPEMPKVEARTAFEIEQQVLKEMVNGVAFAVSEDENRPVLMGVCINIKNGQLDVVAIDGFSAAWRKMAFNSTDMFMLPRGKDLENVCRLLDRGTVKISSSDNLCYMETENMQITLRALNGEYMIYERIFPTDFETTAKVRTKEFLQALERSLLFREQVEGKCRGAMTIDITQKGFKMTLASTNGLFDEEFPADVGGKDLKIGFDPLKLYNCVKHIADDETLMKFTSTHGPCTLHPVDGDGYSYLALPVRF